jgi:hypothetical protein
MWTPREPWTPWQQTDAAHLSRPRHARWIAIPA